MAVDSVAGGAGIVVSSAVGDVVFDFDAPSGLSLPGNPTMPTTPSSATLPTSLRLANIAYVRSVAPPAGGAINQVLAKASATNFDYAWVNQSGGPVKAEDVSVDPATLIPVAVGDVQAALVDIYDRGVFIADGGLGPGPVDNGWVIGSPTGGAMGPGTLNVENGIYSDGTLVEPGVGGPSVDTVAVVNAAGSNQGSAFGLSAVFNVVGVVNDGEGVRLPGGITTGSGNCYVRNSGDNSLRIYPPTGGVVNKLAANASIIVPPDTTAFFKSTSATQWYTVP